MNDQQGTPTLSVPQALGRLRVALNSSFTRTSRELDLTPQQAELLCYAFQPRSISDLAGLLHCDRSNASYLVDRAVTRGLLARRPDDRDGRVSLVTLTDDGHALATDFIRRLESLTSNLRAAWTQERTAAASGLLTEIAEVLETP